MSTTNTQLEQSSTWTEIDFTIISNRGSYDVEYVTNPTQPVESFQGHVLHPSQGISKDELPSELKWFRSKAGSATLVISE